MIDENELKGYFQEFNLWMNNSNTIDTVHLEALKRKWNHPASFRHIVIPNFTELPNGTLVFTDEISVTDAGFTVAKGDAVFVATPEAPAVSPVAPPASAEFFLRVFAPKKRRDAFIGDLLEKFARDCETDGVNRARLRYWAEVISAIGPRIWRCVRAVGAVTLITAALKKYLAD